MGHLAADDSNQAAGDARGGRSGLRRGWTTGACATAATKAAYTALLTGVFPDPVSIVLPRGDTPSFALARQSLSGHSASASIIKDAGDDPDVTHGAVISAELRRADPGCGIVFEAGPGVGTITLPGLPIAPGEAAINPVPRRLMQAVVTDLAARFGQAADVVIRLSVDDGELLAARTWNPRLGIVGGLSILGTTGVVIPYSCSAWIHSIHRGVDVARAAGLEHVAASTGATSEARVQAQHGLPDIALLDMGDFAGALLKYLRDHPLPRLTIAGGFGKLAKLADGHPDLHSARSQVDVGALADRLAALGAPPAQVLAARQASSAGAVLALADAHAAALANCVARDAREAARAMLTQRNGSCTSIQVDVLVVGRAGDVLGASDA